MKNSNGGSPPQNARAAGIQKEKSPAFRERQVIKNYKNVRLLKQQAQQQSLYQLSAMKNRSPVDSLENSSTKLPDRADAANISPSKMNVPSLNMESVNNALLKLQNIGGNKYTGGLNNLAKH